jgi:hypothetical protein
MRSASVTRRSFLGAVGATAIGTSWSPAQQTDRPRKKIAVVTTVWNYKSHAWHMAERFLAGFPLRGQWHRPPIQVVSAYVDQVGSDDLSRQRAEEFGFTRYRSIAEALRCGGERLAVDGVLVIGEHGNYPVNAIGQKQYPRYEFFQQIVDVFRRAGRSVPVFNDKHLSWRFEWAKEMVETARQLDFAFQGGSSLPVTWRMPAIDMPWQAEVEEALGVAFGKTDIYDFHALEMIECMLERRRGGETGVTAVQALRGPAVWQAMAAGSWDRGGWDPRLFEACLSRSHTLRQGETFSHRYPTPAQIQTWVQEPIAYRVEYGDGTRATMLLLNGLVNDFTFAARLKGTAEPLSTLFQLPPNPNVVYSAALMSHAATMFETGRAVYPVERTLLTSGLVAAGLESLSQQQRRLPTPQLAVRYTAPRESTFWRE